MLGRYRTAVQVSSLLDGRFMLGKAIKLQRRNLAKI